jgi:acetyltransferase-like isoleucine patch superfamily enzyme
MIARTAIIHPGVVLGERVVIEDFCVIGIRPAGDQNIVETVIGDDAIIRAQTVIYAGNVIGRRFHTGNKANVRECNTIGDDVSVGTLSVVEHHVRIDDGARIHTQAFVPEFTVLEMGCWIGPHTVLTNARFPLSPGVKSALAGPVVEQRAMVGANATLLPGVRIGARSLIGAGSVVTHDIPPGVIAAGVPARVLREIHY